MAGEAEPRGERARKLTILVQGQWACLDYELARRDLDERTRELLVYLRDNILRVLDEIDAIEAEQQGR